MKANTPDRSQDASVAAQARLVAALRRTLGSHFRVLETHISFVLLTGRYAYKFKKAVDLGFLDFRTLSSRLFYCEEELRLNRRLAPGIYLDVVAISGSADAPILGGNGPPIEYALRMREFRQDSLATRALARNALSPSYVDALATQVAAFHDTADADRDGTHGGDETNLRLALHNLDRVRPTLADPARVRELDEVRAWTLEEHAALAAIMNQRRVDARVRECHGDLHLGNIAEIDGHPVIFDCIEFNSELRWIDVISDVAFLVMDLRFRGRPDLAHRFLNAYLEITGDYDGLRVLPFYLVYRAMVRAMVAGERAAQLATGAARNALLTESRGYVALARRYIDERRPAIVITHGFSGCGKTTASQSLVEALAGVRLRTDVERKRMHGLRPIDRDPAGLGAALYSAEATRRAYSRVIEMTRASVAAGFATIVDGAFLWRWQRALFRELARELDVPFLVVTFEAREATLRARIAQRLRDANDASDADLAVLDQQLRSCDPLDAGEAAESVTIDTERPAAHSSTERWRTVTEALERQRIARSAVEPQRAAATEPG